MRKILLIVLCVIITFSACKKNKKEEKNNKKIATVESAPSFNADSAFYFVKAQTDFGPRIPNSVAHKTCASFLTNCLKRFCDTVIVQSFVATTYDGNKLNSFNIIGSFSPEKEKRVLLAAHWDSRHIADHDPVPEKRTLPIDGANDGASGVGVLLEIARQLSIKNASIGVDIIFFDAEDYGTPSGENIQGDWWCLGSQYWARNPHRPNYHATFGILLDMVGAPDAQFFQEGFSSQYAQHVLSKVWSKAFRLGYQTYFINKPSNYITDDHYYVNRIARIPMINIVHQDNNTGTGFNYTWHTTMDNISNIDKNTLSAVGITVLSVIYSEN